MIRTPAASRYARALAEVVLSPGSGLEPRGVAEQVRRVEQWMASSSELRHVMLSPAVASSKKRAVIGHFATDLGLAPKVLNFLYVVIDHRRMDQLPAIVESFETIIDEELGFARADVTSAQPLTDSERGALASGLGKLTGKRMRMQFATDESLIGGVIARIGSTVYDGSVRGQLESLRRRLTAES
jgi:F-type H+-transporting ATPase subunit delta